MARLDGEKLKKLKRGEALGYVCAAVCALAIIWFAVGFFLAEAYSLYALKLSTIICAPVLAVISAGGAAFCNLKFGGTIERETEEYIKQTFIENAALMHPERTSLNFSVSLSDCGVEVKVNGYKEKIIFDFSPLGKLSVMRKSTVTSQIIAVLTSTFCRLYDRGAKFTEVSYSTDKRKNGGANYIICDGIPDSRAYKSYLKSK